MFDRRLLTHFNWPLLLAILFISAAGLATLKSATSTFEVSGQSSYFQSQLLHTALGLFIMLVIVSLHYRNFLRMSFFIYGGSVFLLILVLIIGRKIAGHQSWIRLGPVSLQPTELAKLGLIIGLARHFAQLNTPGGATFRDLIPSLLFFLIPAGLVMMQHDLGSTLFFGLIYATLVLFHGVRPQVILGAVGGAVLLVVFAFFFVLSPYQKDRVANFMHPERDIKGSGYHLVQSKIAVGSGSITGKGYLKGQTHKLKFVPERHTDFIFTVFAEEWGFIGGVVVMTGYLLILLLGISVANLANDRFSFFLSIGVVALIFWHLVINLGGILGIIPLTGVPLPFFSYGGSALLTNWMAMALVLNVSMRRFMF